ncbi:MAG: tyrosine-type recombinase/integrase [Candidatus Parcubacteria bacterium]|nr:tyrosine-type recombinase/integrase [Candidatus Parcubacteria bacterium]
MQNLLRQFLKYLATEKNRTPQTVANYNFYLTRFLSWAKITEPKKIDSLLIKNYQLWLARPASTRPLRPQSEASVERGERTDHFGKPLKKSTQNYHLIALRSWLKFLEKNNFQAANFTNVKLNRAEPNICQTLSAAELTEILAVPLKTKAAKNIQLRDKALLEILLATGLKVSALSGLKKEEIDLDTGKIVINSQKYNLSNQGKYYLKLYLARRRDNSPFLFVREDKAKDKKSPANLTPRSIQRIIKNYAKNCGQKIKVTPQIIRQTALNRRFV